MNPATLQLAIAILQATPAAFQAIAQMRAAASATDQAQIDELVAAARAAALAHVDLAVADLQEAAKDA